MKNFPATTSSINFYFGKFSVIPVDKKTFVIVAVLETNYLVMLLVMDHLGKFMVWR